MSLSAAELAERLRDAGNSILNISSSSCSTQELIRRLQTTENLLGQVEQEPPQPVEDALLPSMTALISDELFRHSEMDVKVSVVACITELVRISAPEAPYGDEQMKEVFQLTIAVFDRLSPTEGHRYLKAKSILGVVSRIRSCVLLLDLECSALIVEMFQHFLKHIGSDHPEVVFQSMEAIMTMVVDESEGLPLGVLSVLLASVRKENRHISPFALRLAQNVITKCAATLEPYIVKEVETMNIDLNDYIDIVVSIYQNGISNNSKDKSRGDDSKVKKEPRDGAGPSKIGKAEDGASNSTSNGMISTTEINHDNSVSVSESLPVAKTLSGLTVIHPEESYSKGIPELKESQDKCKSEPRSILLDDKDETDQQKMRGLEKEGPCESAPSFVINLDDSETEADFILKRRAEKPKAIKKQDDSRVAAETNISLSDKMGKTDVDQESVPKGKDPKTSILESPKGHLERDNSREVIGPNFSLSIKEEKCRTKSSPKPNSMVSPVKGRPKQFYSRRTSTLKHTLSNVETKPTTVSRKRGRKPNSLMNPDEGYDHSWITQGTRTPMPARQRKSRSGKSSSSPSSPENVIEPQGGSKPELDETIRTSLESSKLVDAIDCGMEDCLKIKRSVTSKEADTKSPSVLKREQSSAQVEEKTPKPVVIDLKKEVVDTDLAKEKEHVRVTRRALATKTKRETASASGHGIALREAQAKLEAKKVENSSGLKDSRRRKKSNSDIKNTDSESGIKSSNADTSHKGKGNESIFKRRRVIGKEEASESPNLGESLVGRGIMVWWPMDKTFYEGVVHSYNPLNKKHKISYIDGDEEILNLKRERYHLIGPDPLADEGQKTQPVGLDASSPVLSIPQEGKIKRKLVQKNQLKQEKVDSSSESNLLKRMRKPRSVQKSSQEKQENADQFFKSYQGKGKGKGIRKVRSVRGKQVEMSDEGEQAKVDSSSESLEDAPKTVSKGKKVAPMGLAKGKSTEAESEFGDEECAGKLVEMSKSVKKKWKFYCSSPSEKN